MLYHIDRATQSLKNLKISCETEYFEISVGVAGFEPATSWSQTRRDDRTTLRPEKISPKDCGETGTRTLATVARRQISNLLRYHSGTSPCNIYKNVSSVIASANIEEFSLQTKTFS